MKKIEWIRESLSARPTSQYLKEKEDAGWRLVAAEWEREVEAEAGAGAGADSQPARAGDEIPFGLRVAGDCLHLEENPSEMQVLNYLAEMIVQDVSYTRMAEALNQRSFRMRDGRLWTAVAVFKLTPRLIEAAPRILSGREWDSRKKQMSRVAWNS